MSALPFSCRSRLALVLLWAATALTQEPRELTPGLRSISGVEPSQQIAYARLLLVGVPVLPGAPPEAMVPATDPATAPVLIAQCTRNVKGKYHFELMMNFGGIKDVTYHPPWRSTGPDDLFAPPLKKTSMTFDFYGYTRVKPVKRQWEAVLEPDGEYRYSTPGGGSRNMEEVMFYLQYLKALPTLRITHEARAAQFQTAALLTAMHNEPLCWKSGV